MLQNYALSRSAAIPKKIDFHPTQTALKSHRMRPNYHSASKNRHAIYAFLDADTLLYIRVRGAPNFRRAVLNILRNW